MVDAMLVDAFGRERRAVLGKEVSYRSNTGPKDADVADEFWEL